MPSSLPSSDERQTLDKDPPGGLGRSAPRGSRDLISTPDGEIDPQDEENDDGGAGGTIVAIALRSLQGLEHHARVLGSVFPATIAITQDAITVLRQSVPQQINALLSGAPMGVAPGSPLPPPAAPPAPAGGMGQLVGTGGGGMPPSAAPPMQ